MPKGCKYTKEEILNNLISEYKKYKRTLSYQEINKSENLPHSSTIRKIFNKPIEEIWNDIIRENKNISKDVKYKEWSDFVLNYDLILTDEQVYNSFNQDELKSLINDKENYIINQHINKKVMFTELAKEFEVSSNAIFERYKHGMRKLVRTYFLEKY